MGGLDWNSIIIALISGVSVAVPASIIAWRTHKAVNSSLSEVLRELKAQNLVAVESARVQATLEEKAAQHVREQTLQKGETG